MLNQIIKWTLIASFYKRYKRQIIVTVIAIVAFLVVDIVHQDYLAYARAVNDPNVANSFYLKWLLVLGILFAYIIALKIMSPKRRRKLVTRPANPAATQQQANAQQQGTGKDPFERIRKREKLRSRGDMTISKVRVRKR